MRDPINLKRLSNHFYHYKNYNLANTPTYLADRWSGGLWNAISKIPEIQSILSNSSISGDSFYSITKSRNILNNCGLGGGKIDSIRETINKLADIIENFKPTTEDKIADLIAYIESTNKKEGDHFGVGNKLIADDDNKLVSLTINTATGRIFGVDSAKFEKGDSDYYYELNVEETERLVNILWKNYCNRINFLPYKKSSTKKG